MHTTSEEQDRRVAALTTVHGRVADVRRLTPNMLEVTLTGFERYPLAGGDEFVYVMVSSEPGGISPAYGIDDVRRQDPDDSVRGAFYTVRRARPDVGELDIWVVEHDHSGSIGSWFAGASSGVDRQDGLPGVGDGLLAAVVALEDAPDAAFGAGEFRQISAIRRHVRHTLRVPAARVLMTGYWRRQDVA